MRQKLEESNLFFERALRINPNDWATRRNLASNQFLLGHLEPAQQNLESILKSKPDDKTSVLLLGMVAENLKDYNRAVKLLASVPALVQQRPESLAALARSYYQTNQKQKARETLKSLQDHSADYKGAFLGGQVAAEVRDYEIAERLFGSIESTYPDKAKLGYNLALVQYQGDHIEQCQATLLKLIEAGVASSDIYNLLAWCYHKRGDLKEAVAAMDLAIDREPSRESSYLDLGMILLSHERLPVALESAKKAVETAPGSYQAHMLKGLVEAKMNHLKDAAMTYDRAIQLNPEAPEALLALALVYSADGKAREAEQALKRGLEKFPQNPILYQECGKLLLKFGAEVDPASQSRAVSMFQTALSLNPSLAESHYQLGNLALGSDKTREALQHLEAAAKLSPKNSKTHFALARLYRRLGRADDASKELALYESSKSVEERLTSNNVARGDRPTLPNLSRDD
jgi:tetratricopeptide (TPR) repeat protein